MYRTAQCQSEFEGMGTVISTKVYGDKCADAALQEAFLEINRLEGIFSRFITGSEISRINSSAGIGYVSVSIDTYEVLLKSIEISKVCNGCFDVTIGPLVTLWTGAGGKSEPPAAGKIHNTLSLVNYKDLILKPDKKGISLKSPGQSIDLGAVGKGYTADKVMEVFKEYNIKSAFTNLGGNVATFGSKPDGSPWQIGIRHPRMENSLIGVISAVNKSVVTSGDYERFYKDSRGKTYHHVLNPKTGYPSDSGLISTTIVSDSSMLADALSTALFVAGLDKGMEFLKCFPGTEAVLIDSGLRVYITRGLKKSFKKVQGLELKVLN